ncbi:MULTISPECIES: YceD family protein [unclassified Carboxylicivirga]|uniref:YceD family protein n=1 Tax=Carboxylicivirga TaxID=1628153 RepID=UPI003D32EF86
MDRLKNYSIPFKGLKEGKHLFNYEIGDEFFALFEQPLVEKGQLKACVELSKSSALFSLNFTIEGQVETICDNCLGTLTIPLSNTSLVYIKFGEEYDEPTEEIIVLPHNEHAVNVAQLIYELICVALPIRHLHPEDEDGNVTCDAEMLNQLNDYLVDEETEEEQDDDTDPRWAALKNLVDKSNK